MNDEMVKSCLKYFKGTFKQGEDNITNFLRKFMLKNGTRVFIENEEIYTHKVHFDTGDTSLDSTLELPPDQMNFASMEKEDLWAYIYGEYILNGRLNKIWGFGITQTETY